MSLSRRTSFQLHDVSCPVLCTLRPSPSSHQEHRSPPRTSDDSMFSSLGPPDPSTPSPGPAFSPRAVFCGRSRGPKRTSRSQNPPAPLRGHQAARIETSCNLHKFQFPVSIVTVLLSASYCKLLLSARGGGEPEISLVSVPREGSQNFWGGPGTRKNT